MPCQHRGICTPLSNVLYECECIKGYFGKNCEKGGSSFYGMERQILSFADDYTTLDTYYNRSHLVRGLPPVPLECPTPLGIKGPKNLPDVEKVFEILFRRREFKPCPYGTNLMLATFAQHLSHQFFDMESPSRRSGDFSEDGVSHIYGSDEATRRAFRRMVDGKLKARIINGEEFPPYMEDVPGVTMVYPESEKLGETIYPKWAMGHKLFSMTPLMFAMATVWLREHNRLCDIILKEHPDWSDERIYQTVRCIVLGELLTITAGEYFQHLAQYRLKFGYKPEIFHDSLVLPSTRMQYEFGLISQWHQTMPDVMSVNGNYYNLTNLMFSNNRIVFEHGLDAIVDAMSRNPAGEMTYRNCGEAVKDGMKNLIEEGRKMRLHSLNDYRRFFELKPYESFMELVGDEETAEALQDLYGDIDAVEFIVGVFMERHSGSVIPPTMMYLVGPMALKGVMVNPLGSPALWKSSTFGGKTGFDIVQKATLQKLFCLNLKGRCKNNVWISFRTPDSLTWTSRRKIFKFS